MSTLVEVRETLAARRKSAFDIFAKYDDVGSISDDDAKELDRLNKEMAPLGEEFDRLSKLDQEKRANEAEYKRMNDPAAGAMRHAGQQTQTTNETPVAYKSPGEKFVESAAYKGWRGGHSAQTVSAEVIRPQAQYKTTFTNALAALTNYQRVPGIVTVGTQVPHVADLLSQGQTTAPTIRYVQEVSFTNAATAVAEGATKPEAAFNTIEVDAPVRKIAVTAKVTDELFADFAMLRDYVNNRLDLMLELTEDSELLTGSGSAPHILGLLNVSGIQTQARGTDPAPDAVYKAMVKIMTVGFFDPDGIVMHPLNWQSIRLLTTTTGQYIFGNPGDVAPQRLWGLNVVTTTTMTQNTALVGAYKLGAQLWRRDEGAIEATNSNEDDFKKNLVALRDEERIALACYRPLAFCTVTGLP